MNLPVSLTSFFAKNFFHLPQPFRAAVSLCLAFTLFLTTLSFGVSAHEASISEIENDDYVFYVDQKGKLVCRDATPSESREMEDAAPKNLRPINHLEYATMKAQSAATDDRANAETHLTIILNATARLEANPAAKDAFIRAAAAWESRISSPITIYVQADLGPTFFDSPTNFPSGILGQTSGASNSFSYPVVRDRLLAGASPNTAKAVAYNALPTNDIPTDLGTASSVAVPRTLARAIGLLDPIADPGDNPPRIGFNSAFNFDFDSSNGITPGQFDFEAVATHEIGHALGFTSRAGSGSTTPAMWDLYRFRSGTTTSTFTTAQRILTIGGPQLLSQYYFVPGENYFVPGQKELGLSDGGPDGVTTNNADGNQSSHWRGPEWFPFLGIGIMQPHIAAGVHGEISKADMKAIEIFGYSIVPIPPPNDKFIEPTFLLGCTGSVKGTNEGATREPGEPVHSPGSTRSVWYSWPAPASSSVTITTQGSNFNTVLGIYTGNDLSNLVTIAQNDDVDPVNTYSSVTFNAQAGTVYRIAVDGSNSQNSGGDVGSIQLNWNSVLCANGWFPTVVNPSQVELRSWTISGITSVYIKLTFPDAGFRVSFWGVPGHTENAWSLDPTVERFNGPAAQAISNTASIQQLGPLPAGQYTFTFKNAGTNLKTLDFTVSTTAPPANLIDDAREFVRWQYKDFLRREPDAPGWDHWTGEITQCADAAFRLPGETQAKCVDRKRTNTSGAFFLSPEFQNTGYFVLRVYRGSLGRMPHYGGGNTAVDEFTRDSAAVSQGIVVNDALAPNVINANKAAFANEFVTRTEFRAIYDGLNNLQYVDKLFQTTGVNPSASDRQALIDGLNGGTLTRAQVLFNVVDGTQTGAGGALTFNTTYGKAFYDALFNQAFVQMEYFGYLLRDPDPNGYASWLAKLDLYGNFVDAEMVRAFILSPEYRSRFGAP